MRFRLVPKSTTLKNLERRIQGLPKVFKVPAIFPGTGKATDFKFGRYIHRGHPNKSPLKMAEKRERAWVYPGTVQFFRVPHIISVTGKGTNFKYCIHVYRFSRNKSPLTISGKVAVGLVRHSRKFSGHPIYRAHRTVIFAIAQLACYRSNGII